MKLSFRTLLGVMVFASVAASGVTQARAQEAASKADTSRPPHFDFKRRQFLIEGSYKIIPSEPVRVDSRRQLLVDNYVIDDIWGCRRTVHAPDKSPDNPVIASRKTGLQEADEGTVLYDENLKRFRLWTLRWDLNRKSYDSSYVQVYYESPDGVHWTRPNLDLVEHEGSRANNFLRSGKGEICAMPSVVKVPPRLADRGKYAMFYGHNPEKIPPGYTHNMEERVAWSEDGIHWKDQPENPVFRGRDDVFPSLVYNPDRDVFMLYRRPPVNANEIRRLAYSESKDLISWTQPRVIILPDELDPPMLYGMSVSSYQGIYFGLLQMFYIYPTTHPSKMKYGFTPQYAGFRTGPKALQIDLQLAWSRDGIEWHRHPQRPTFIPTGLPGSYDWGMVVGLQGMPEVGNKIHIYYTGDEAFHIVEQVKSNRGGHLCLATLRKDGFVSLDTPEEGYMLTKPLLCPGGKLHINADVEQGGFVKVAVRRGDGVKDGDWLDDWNYDSGPVFTGDSTDSQLQWKAKTDFRSLNGQSIRLHFWMKQAKLYSFWFE